MSNDGQDKQERPERQPDRQPEHVKRAQGEINANVSDYTEQVSARRLEKKLSGNSGATGQLPDKDGKGLASAKDLLGDNAHGLSKKEKQAALLAQVEKDGYIVGKPKDEKQEALKAERLEQVEKNYHRDIARQIKDAIKGTPHLDKNEAQPELKQLAEKPSEIKPPVRNVSEDKPTDRTLSPEDALKQRLEQREKNKDNDVAERIKNVEPWFVHRHNPDANVDYNAAKQGYEQSGLNKYPEVSPELVSAVLRNEQWFYKPTDASQDATIQNGGHLSDKTNSIGPAQIQIRNIQFLIDEKNSDGKPTYSFLQNMKDDPQKAAENPANAALLASAWLKHIAGELEKQNIPVNDKTLAYRWNADVYSFPNPLGTDPRFPESKSRIYGSEAIPANIAESKLQVRGLHNQFDKAIHVRRELYPNTQEILDASTHVQNVMRQLQIVKALHPSS